MTDAVSAIGQTASADSIRNDYLKLLATQLSNQNPLEPMDNHDMTLQMAALAELEQMENISNTFQKLLRSYDMVESSKLIGKKVTFFPKDSHGVADDTSVTGIVTDVNVVDSEVKVRVNGHNVAIDEIVNITGTDELTTKVDMLLDKIKSPEQRQLVEQLLAEAPVGKQEQMLQGMVDRIDYLPDNATLQQFYNWLSTIPAVEAAL
jgi:flagellar basal-body rod modification protein FlgD